jgi:hypothetical protein
MSDQFDKSWFDKVTFDMREQPGGKISVHIFKVGHSCRLIDIDEHMLIRPDLWTFLRAKAEAVWMIAEDLGSVCPNCESRLRDWERRFQGRRFCGRCGRDL